MPTQVPYSQLRASDAERERVVTFLREHALAGRLRDEELEERIGLAYAAVTVGDLEALIGDLPRANRPAPRPARPPKPRRQPSAPCPLLIVAGIALIVFTALPVIVLAGIVALLAIVIALSFALGPFLLVAVIVMAARRRRPRPPMRWGPQH